MTASAQHNTGLRPAWRVAVSFETAAYALIFLAAIGLRAIALGNTPLSGFEAGHAVAALSLIRSGTAGAAIESPFLFATSVIGTAVLGANPFAVRLAPLLVGLGLVISPLLFRQRLGRLATLAITAWLALSPVAVYTSRRMTGIAVVMLAIVLALAALDAFVSRRARHSALLMGIAVGAALLADYAAGIVLICLGVGLAFAFLTDEEKRLSRAALKRLFAEFPQGALWAGLAGAVILLSTLFFLAPGGLASAADQISRFLAGFIRRAPSASLPVLSLALYEPVTVMFGLAGAWLASQSPEPWKRALAGWGVMGILASLLYQGALPGHTLWATVPLAALAGLAVESLLALEQDSPRWSAAGHVAATLALLAMMLASLTHHLRAPRMLPFPANAPPEKVLVTLPVDLVLVGLWLVLLGIVLVGVISVWGQRTAWRSVGLSVLIAGAAWAAGQSASLAFVRHSSPYEPLNVSPVQPGLDRLVRTAEEISKLDTGTAHDAPLVVQADQNSVMAWAFRRFAAASFVPAADPTVSAVMVVTPFDDTDPALGSRYVGQDFVVVREWLPRGLSLPQVLSWLIYRTAPTQPVETRAILWVREDIYRLVPAGGDLGLLSGAGEGF